MKDSAWSKLRSSEVGFFLGMLLGGFVGVSWVLATDLGIKTSIGFGFYVLLGLCAGRWLKPPVAIIVLIVLLVLLVWLPLDGAILSG